MVKPCNTAVDKDKERAGQGPRRADQKRSAPDQQMVNPCDTVDDKNKPSQANKRPRRAAQKRSLPDRSMVKPKGTAADKFKALDAAGVATVRSPAELGSKMQEVLGG